MHFILRYKEYEYTMKHALLFSTYFSWVWVAIRKWLQCDAGSEIQIQGYTRILQLFTSYFGHHLVDDVRKGSGDFENLYMYILGQEVQACEIFFWFRHTSYFGFEMLLLAARFGTVVISGFVQQHEIIVTAIGLY
jgi:hypothetical protein